jgi:ABC-type nitrate/sulfonate/bicarbonate transport system ATPase subunit
MNSINNCSSDAGLEVDLQSFTYNSGNIRGSILRNISFTAPPGKITVIMGRSGCGKTTLLRLLAGIQSELTLHLHLSGEVINPPDSKIGIVFQDYRLFPWKTVEDNIICSAEAVGQSPFIANELIEEFKLAKLRREWPKTLSGGEHARVALARCLVQQPKVLLLDEVFRSLDLLTRIAIFDTVKRLTQKHALITIAVTHDVDEARRTADQVLVLEKTPATVGQIIHRIDEQGSSIQQQLASVLMNNE